MRNEQEIAAVEAICKACPQWDARTPGCKLFKSCERKALTRSIWRLGHCVRKEEKKW
jgi:hypothetical protein